MEKPLYPSQYMRITEGYMKGSHRDSYAIDDAGIDQGIDYLKAPYTGVIKKIYQKDANEIWLESIEPVIYPDGTVDYLTMLFAHDNDISNLFVGKVIAKGERFYEEGTKGEATGNHVHMECGKGKFTNSGWHKNNSGHWSINNAKNPTECLWIDDSITIINDNGYKFRKIEKEESPKKPQEEIITEEPKKEESPKEDSQNLQLIYTCRKSDTYAINLNNGDKLYIEKYKP